MLGALVRGRKAYAPRRSATLATVSNLDRRRGYTPRRRREARAYRLAMIGAGSGVAGVVTLVLAIAGVITLALPIILLIVAALCAYNFMRATGQR